MLNKLNAREREHLARVKALPCSVCDAPGPSEAHHVKQQWWQPGDMRERRKRCGKARIGWRSEAGAMRARVGLGCIGTFGAFLAACERFCVMWQYPA